MVNVPSLNLQIAEGQFLLILFLLLLLQKLLNLSLLLFFKLTLLLFLTNIGLKVIKLLLSCSLTFLIIEYWLWDRLNRGISNRNQNWLFNNFVLIIMPEFSFILNIFFLFLDLLMNI